MTIALAAWVMIGLLAVVYILAFIVGRHDSPEHRWTVSTLIASAILAALAKYVFMDLAGQIYAAAGVVACIGLGTMGYFHVKALGQK